MSELESWFIAGASTQNYITVCSEQKILGGYYKFGMGTAVQQLFMSHLIIKLELNQQNFWKLGCWENKIFYIIIDELVQKYQFGCLQGTSQCGYSYRDLQSPIKIIIPHQSETLVILFKTNVNNWKNEFWSVNNFYLDILKCVPESLLCNENSSDICKPRMDIPIELIGFLKQMLMYGYQKILCLLNQLFVLIKYLQLEDIRFQGDQNYLQLKLNSIIIIYQNFK
ncbi:unnamed protein product [Paramecium pentaurelia]|uniref:Uncharacterized protein n=1 Tax=Paramecium pentaurelia TaxID=43138 RepID=A0A8S1SSF4_9CILI|nr:unnamed protein product [Paramecium pentaurelia]